MGTTCTKAHKETKYHVNKQSLLTALVTLISCENITLN